MIWVATVVGFFVLTYLLGLWHVETFVRREQVNETTVRIHIDVRFHIGRKEK